MASNNATESTDTIEIITQRVVQAQSNPIFLQTTAAQAIAGLFVWTAVFVTCQQIYTCVACFPNVLDPFSRVYVLNVEVVNLLMYTYSYDSHTTSTSSTYTLMNGSKKSGKHPTHGYI